MTVLAYTIASGRYRGLIRHPLRHGLPYGLLLWGVMTYVVVPLSQAQPSAKPLLLAVATNFLMHLLLGLTCAWFARRAHGLRSRSGTGWHGLAPSGPRQLELPNDHCRH